MESGLRKLRPPLRLGLVILGIVAALASGPRMLRPAQANPSSLLNTVKNNPGMAEELCQQFNTINANEDSVYSSAGLEEVASSQGITTSDAEILVTYVVGLYCPDVT
ncbi:MAG: hypothetical protein F4Z67_03385 [Synechococcus sp. SB0667_bin_8]|uniref:DUF732 domain-containing protein n=1 Tax=Synechococcus sp. SB0676_bin_10 TaxID=2604869 RepID=A0A6B1F9U8_9SYNE|nr:hypothetical protein [Synechococcus sp. SB0667_bin_8]MXY19383.1 hypothetical protein [Synechococcus sp. SB0664_bin_36]MYG38997.1 hypothetical protein [Synechococcus sp. SB0676_bin_10]MYG64336.1 hypothetical protein [Synechococcus sp. SB0675_bin_7]MYK07472.1 hypothetical protein [Synechococcus sp. SB0670_bin_20]MYK85414.1 hypothetical protein [Synechococcus sp. SB0669_bin_7]